jgi:hypothetical protein
VSRPRTLFLAPAALLIPGIWLWVTSLGDLCARPVAFVVLYGVAFVAYLLAVVAVLRAAPGRGSLVLILASAALMRLAALPGPHSDDVNRYLWEAEVQRAGMNPYVLAPDAPELAELRAGSPWYEGVNHEDWPAIYPPLTMLWQRVFGSGPTALKLSFLAAEALAIALLMLLLKSRNEDPDRVLVYAWNPLPVYVFAHQGHNDAISIALLLLALWLAGRAVRPRSAVLAFSGSVLAKGFALAAWPALLPLARLRTWLLAIPLAALLYAPFLDAGPGLFGSLTRFGVGLDYNDSVHAIFDGLLRAAGDHSGYAARALAAGVWFLVLLWVVRRVPRDPLLRSAWLIGGMLLVLPTAHAWYFTLLLPLLAFFPWPGWILLTGSLALPHLAQLEITHTGRWVEWHWLKLIEYAPLFAWLAWRGIARRESWSLRAEGARP